MSYDHFYDVHDDGDLNVVYQFRSQPAYNHCTARVLAVDRIYSDRCLVHCSFRLDGLCGPDILG